MKEATTPKSPSKFSWPALLRRPADFDEGATADAWFTRLAARLLNGSHLVAAGQPHRLAEVEIYYYHDAHPDPFSHRDPLQRQTGRWYFHKTHGGYRGGSFKGLDLTFGDAAAFGGILIRSLETPHGTLIDGPSLCVDHLLAATPPLAPPGRGIGGERKSVAALDAAIAGRVAWDPQNPLMLQALDAVEERPLYRTARVGLTLKKTSAEAFRFLLRLYRFLTEPRRIAKGKAHTVRALYAQGMDVARIREVTGSPPKCIARYVEDFATRRRDLSGGRWTVAALHAQVGV
jgi:hypothetical protein